MAPDFNRNVHCLLGLPFDVVDLDQAEQKLREAIRLRSRCFLSTPNLNFLIACQNDAAFRNSVISSDLVVADGMPVVWLAKLLGIPISHRVAGASLFERLREGFPESQIRVFFFGGQDGVAEAACQKVNLEARGVRCVGYMSPGFGSIENMSEPSIIEKINNSGADFLIVSLGAQKGQEWIMRNLEFINIPVVSHLGAVINFVAGTVKRAPKILQVTGLEWLWRIREEPNLWRRYFRDGLGLVRIILTKVLPAIFSFAGGIKTLEHERLGSVWTVYKDDKALIFLSGHWSSANISSFREALLELVRRGESDVVLDFTAVTHVDSAVVGLILLLNKRQKSINHGMRVVNSTGHVAKAFRKFGAESLLLS